MGSLFRKKHTRGVPLGATIEKSKGQLIATWRGRRGKIFSSPVKLSPKGEQTVQVESPIYYAKYTDSRGAEVVVSTRCKDRSSAERVLLNLEREVERIRAGIQTEEETDRKKLSSSPLAKHIEDFHASHAASDRHRRETVRYLRKLADALGWRSLGDLDRSELEAWLVSQQRGGVGPRTRNGYLAAVVTFANWLEATNRIDKSPLKKLKKANEEADRRRPRRAYTEEEYRRLIAAARSAKIRPKPRDDSADARPAIRMTARERADLYTVLFGTGLRIGELRKLTFTYIVDDDHPRIEVPEWIAKNRRPRVVPLRPEILKILKSRPGSDDPGHPVFEIPDGINRRLDHDLKRAGLEKYDARGRQLDIHAMRKTFGTWLARAGVNPRALQAIMGHRDINITFRLYIDVGIRDAFEAIEKLPNLSPELNE